LLAILPLLLMIVFGTGCHHSAQTVEPDDVIITLPPKDPLSDTIVCSDEPLVTGPVLPGCPVPLIQVHLDRIAVNWDIGFDRDGNIDAPSTPVIDLLATLLQQDRTFRKIEIGLMRLDRKGKDDSSAKAQKVVDRLVELGIEKDRLSPKGLGIAPERDASGAPIRSPRMNAYRMDVPVLSRNFSFRQTGPQGSTAPADGQKNGQ
jgi:hypothetical protein